MKDDMKDDMKERKEAVGFGSRRYWGLVGILLMRELIRRRRFWIL